MHVLISLLFLLAVEPGNRLALMESVELLADEPGNRLALMVPGVFVFEIRLASIWVV